MRKSKSRGSPASLVSAPPRASRSKPIDATEFSKRQLRILNDLEAIFLHEGFLAFRSVDEIARRVRASKQTLYQLAPSREDLFLLVIRRFLAAWRAEGQAAIENANDWVAAVTDYLDAGVERTRDVSSRFLHDLNAFPRSRKLMREHQLERIAGLEDLLAQGSQERAFNEIDPRVVATVILKLADTLIDPEFQAELGLTMSELCAQVYELLIHGLAPRKVAARRRKRRVPTAKHSS